MSSDKKTYLILPGCDDTNRGDQALIWETVSLARKAGFEGDYYMLAEKKNYHQSAAENILRTDYILEHPSTRCAKGDNIRYTLSLKLKWAFVAVGDIITRSGLLWKFTRRLSSLFAGKRVRESLKLFENADACFVKGGGFLHANGGFADTYKIFFFLYHIRLAQSCGVPVYVMPNSFGPFDSPFVKSMLKKVLKKCRVVTTRESVSAEQLKSKCNFVPTKSCDLAFFLEDDPSFDPYEYQKAKGLLDTDKKRIAITARPYRFPELPDGAVAYEGYKEALSDFVIRIAERGYLPVLVEHVHAELPHEDDMKCIEEIAALIDSKAGDCEYKVFSDRGLNCRQMKQIYGTFDYTVGTRFHSVIFSISSGVPSIAITYGGNKGVGIMHDLGLDGYAIPIIEATADGLIECFGDLCRNEEEIKKTLSQQKIIINEKKSELLTLIGR
ncbi:MAG: polysaccharide pyruvyl transferase family protein [Clostridia bacterium]|nr:polysaccharide pyruvyl transferase family protein [Clostridia bacterium]